MSVFYDSMQSTALSLMTDFGQAILVERVTEEADPVEGTVINRSVASHSFMGIELSMGKGEDKKVFEGLTNVESRKLLLAAKGAALVPQNGDIVTLGGKQWTVQACDVLRPDGATDLTYEVYVKLGGKTTS